jgi:hypothetical protein
LMRPSFFTPYAFTAAALITYSPLDSAPAARLWFDPRPLYPVEPAHQAVDEGR